LRIQLFAAFLFISLSAVVAQDQETRSLDEFEKISVATGIEATLVKGSSNSIDITVDNMDLDRVETEVNNGALKVRVDQNWLKNLFGKSRRHKVEVVITYTEELRAVKSSSGAYVETDGVIETRRISLSSSSGANMNVEIEASEAKASVSSGASMKTYGETNYLEVSVSSGASYNGKKLIAQEVEAKASSGASAQLVAEESIKAKSSSGASITYKGSPSDRDISKSSGGSVSRS